MRSESIFGLSFVIMIFDDSSVNDWNRQKVLERLTQVNLPPQNLQPQIGTDWSTTGQIYWYTLRSTNPRYDLMELRSIEDWVLLKQFKSVPQCCGRFRLRGHGARVPGARGPEQTGLLRIEHRPGGAAVGQQQRNAGGSFVEAGMQQMNVRALGLYRNVQDIEETVLTTKSGTPFVSRTSPKSVRGPKSGWATWPEPTTWRTMASSSTSPMSSRAAC
jgi:heavy metal efflux system protein